MAIRGEIAALVALGPMPSESTATEEQINAYDDAIESIARPVADEEATLLATLFGPDSLAGVAWGLLHLIESAPGWPLAAVLSLETPEFAGREWIEFLRKRLANKKRESQ